MKQSDSIHLAKEIIWYVGYCINIYIVIVVKHAYAL